MTILILCVPAGYFAIANCFALNGATAGSPVPYLSLAAGALTLWGTYLSEQLFELLAGWLPWAFDGACSDAGVLVLAALCLSLTIPQIVTGAISKSTIEISADH